MKTAITKARIVHITEHEGGDIWRCPEPGCGYRVQYRRGQNPVVLNRGAFALTEERANKSIELRKQGRHGEANAIIAAAPSHKRGGGLAQDLRIEATR